MLAPEGNETPFVRFEVEGVAVCIERALLEALPAGGGEILVALDGWGKARVEVERAA